MNRSVLLFLLGIPAAWAHVMSMSTGDVAVDGDKAHYELRMPMYEIAHVKVPEAALFTVIRFSTRGGQAARQMRSRCREEAALGMFICEADYQFPVPVDRLEVECTLYQVTVPNHVHLLRAVKNGKRDQAIFDYSFTKAEIRFEPPTVMETAAKQTGAGALRALGGLVQILFLVSLVLAARTTREQLALGGMFLLGQAAAAVAAPIFNWQPAPRFVEAAMALTIAYMAVEILVLPTAGQRWLVAGVLGVFHGLYFALFLVSSEFRPAYVLLGAAVAEIAVVALLALGWKRLRRFLDSPRLVQVSAGLLFAVGMSWFFVRLRG